jgi:hypothetical protein
MHSHREIIASLLPIKYALKFRGRRLLAKHRYSPFIAIVELPFAHFIENYVRNSHVIPVHFVWVIFALVGAPHLFWVSSGLASFDDRSSSQQHAMFGASCFPRVEGFNFHICVFGRVRTTNYEYRYQKDSYWQFTLRGGWPGLNDLEFVDMGPVRGYHFSNSRESRETHGHTETLMFSVFPGCARDRGKAVSAVRSRAA